VISEPTRLTGNSASCLDHVITNSSDKISKSGMIDFGFSDHLLIFCTRGNVKLPFKDHLIRKTRALKSYSKELFCSELSKLVSCLYRK
jgi:hypothetical protein